MITLKTKQLSNGIIVFASDENKVRYNIENIPQNEYDIPQECAGALLESLDKPVEQLFRATDHLTLNPQEDYE